MPTQKEINEYIVQLIDKRYQEGVLRSQFDVAAGALAVMRLYSLLDDKGEEGDWAQSFKGDMLDLLLYSSSIFSSYLNYSDFLSRVGLRASDPPLEVLPREVEEGIERLKNDPGHAGERAEITGRCSKLLRIISNFNNEDAIGISSDDIKDIGKKIKDMSQRYENLRRQYKDASAQSQILELEYDDLLNRCKEVLSTHEKIENPRDYKEISRVLEGIIVKVENFREGK
jgi:hypothetical protein